MTYRQRDPSILRTHSTPPLRYNPRACEYRTILGSRTPNTNDHAHPNQAGELPLASSSSPEHPSFLIGSDIESLEWDLVGFQDAL